MIPIRLDRLRELHAEAVRRRIKYSLGAKAPSLDAPLKSIRAIDCSGYVRLLLHQASGSVWVLPDGSVQQREWAAKAGLHKLAQYADVEYAAEDGSRLFLCFLAPGAIHKGAAGHVWLCLSDGHAMRTIESRGGKGPSSRAWDSAVLAQHCSAAWELPAE